MSGTNRSSKFHADSLAGDASGQLMMLDPFYDLINNTRRRLRHDIADWMQALVDDLDDIKIKATLDDEEVYMAQAMRSVYEKVRVIKSEHSRFTSCYDYEPH